MTIRRAVRADCWRIWCWRNDPWIRSLGRCPRWVPPWEHWPWFRRATRRHEQHLLWVIEANGGLLKDLSCGVVHVDRADGAADISIYLLREFTGRGYGPEALRLACVEAFRCWPYLEVIRARIRWDNRASCRAFARAGFGGLVRRDEPKGLYWEMSIWRT